MAKTGATLTTEINELAGKGYQFTDWPHCCGFMIASYPSDSSLKGMREFLDAYTSEESAKIKGKEGNYGSSAPRNLSTGAFMLEIAEDKEALRKVIHEAGFKRTWTSGGFCMYRKLHWFNTPEGKAYVKGLK